jgi:ubiquinone/menaquinone biosynthesis C-methylase UbiE
MMAAPHTTAQAWDAAAEGWNRHATLISAWLGRSTAALLDAAAIGPGARVLDLAAGAGDQTLDIARRVGPAGQVLATDISPHFLALARAKLQAAGFDAVQTVVADAQALDVVPGLRDGGFDAVVCRLGLMFCPQPQAALAGALQALRPGGRLAALVFSAPQANPCIAIMVSTALRHAGRAAATPFEPGTLLSLGQPGLLDELLHAAGYAEVRVQALAAPMRLAGVHDYLDFVQTAGLPITAMLAPLPAAAQRAAWQDIEQQLDRFTTDEGWVGPNELLLCSATRPVAGVAGQATPPA